ncbi:MAG: hypothetical protein Q9213_002704 [Squamulea squamosa]
MAIRSLASADDACTVKYEEAHPQLVDLENLVAVRKNITGSNLSVAHLDQIIAKTIENLQKDDDRVHLKGNSALALKELSCIRTEMMAYGGDLSGVNTLIEQAIVSSCGKMGLADCVCYVHTYHKQLPAPSSLTQNIQTLPEHDWLIPVANFTTGSSVFSNKTSKNHLALVYTHQDLGNFSLFDGPLNLETQDKGLGFNINAIMALHWVPSYNKV